MNRFIQILAMAVLSLAFQYFLPWWTLSIPCAVIAFLYGNKSGQSFVNGFIAIAGLWVVAAGIIVLTTGSNLASQIGGLFPGSSSISVFLLTGIAGGLTGGLSAITGYLLRRLI